MEKQLDEVEFNEIKKHVIEEYNDNINELKKEKEIYLRKIEYLQHQISDIEKNMYNYCKRTGGHNWVSEREQCIYGELFTYCEICKLGN